MKSSAKNIVLKSVDDIFQTEENRADAQRERVSIRILSNPDLTNRDLIRRNSNHHADTICIIKKKVKKQKIE